MTQFVNHPLVGNYLTEDDEVLMDFLETFDITFVGDDGSFKMEMVRNSAGQSLRPALDADRLSRVTCVDLQGEPVLLADDTVEAGQVLGGRGRGGGYCIGAHLEGEG